MHREIAFVLMSSIAAADVRAQGIAEQAPQWAAELPAGAIAVAEKREGAWHYALGGKPFERDDVFAKPEHVVFEIGSISKVFTGLLLARAMHEGKLALSDTLGQRLPIDGANATVAAITLEQLATHTSCLPRLPDNFPEANDADPYAQYNHERMFTYLRGAKLAATPPCKADYSNLGFGILGVVLERAYTERWEDLVRAHIAKPLGMVDTVQLLNDDQRVRLATPWAGKEKNHNWTFRAMAGAGALRSTLADMSKFADALIAGANGPLGAFWAEFAKPRADAAGLGAEHMGLGVMQGKYFNDAALTHGGGTGGYRSDLTVLTQSGRAFVILASNADATPSYYLAQAFRAQQPKIERSATALAADALDEYVGVYELGPQATFTVLEVDGALRVRLTGQQFLPVFAQGGDEFFYKAVDAQLSFKRNADDKIDALVLHQNGRDLTAARVALPLPTVLFPDPASLAEFAGEYDLGGGAMITVKAGELGLNAQLTGQPAFAIYATAADRFVWDVVEAALVFERDASGKIVAAVLHQNGAAMRAARKGM
jgi:CubicO group peptidase (beta-lactamase class C family)